LSSQNEITNDCFYIEKGQNEVKIPLNMTLCKVSDISPSSNSSIFVDEDKLSFPLQVRKWELGDLFQPSGMNGQTKKLSKLFKDEKMSLFEKESIWLLCSNQQIVWVIGIRADERFKIDNSTKNIIKISLHQ
jgi:tRNA(Ile)-lysidine synthase